MGSESWFFFFSEILFDLGIDVLKDMGFLKTGGFYLK